MIYTFVPELMLEKPEILQTYNFTPDCEPFIIISDFFLTNDAICVLRIIKGLSDDYCRWLARKKTRNKWSVGKSHHRLLPDWSEGNISPYV